MIKIKGLEFAECGHRESRWLCEHCLADQVDLYVIEAEREVIELKRMITALTHGLESYAHGNASPDLAKSILEKKGNLGTDAAEEWIKAGILKDHEDGFHDEYPLASCPECQEWLDDIKSLS